MLHALLQ
jgi:hypothetical protein